MNTTTGLQNFFDAVAAGKAELDRLGAAYLAALPFMSNEDVGAALWAEAKRLLGAAGGNWDGLPEWAADCLDDHLQYWRVDARGSLAAQLSHSMVSQDAHLRNLLEVAVGRETSLLDFPVGFDYRALLPR